MPLMIKYTAEFAYPRWTGQTCRSIALDSLSRPSLNNARKELRTAAEELFMVHQQRPLTTYTFPGLGSAPGLPH